jgi:AsmA protein
MKKLLIALAVVIAALIVIAVAAPFFIPTDTYKNELIAAVKRSTGRDLKINGKVGFSLLPTLGLEANDVALSNAPGASTPDMVKLAKLDVALKLWPLLSRRVEVDKLVLVDPVIALEVDKQGQPNWRFAAVAPSAPATAPATPAAPAKPQPAGGEMLSGLTLDNVRLENGQISYLDQRTGQTLELQQIAMKLSLPNLDSRLQADGSAVYRGEKLTLQIALANPRSFLAGKSTAADLGLDSKPIAFGFKGTAAGSTPMKLDGAIDLKIPSLRGLAQWAGSPLNAPGTGFGQFLVSGKVNYAGSRVAFTDATLTLDQINGKGEVALDTGGARPAVSGKLAVDKLDLNPYLPPETPGKSPTPAAPAPAAGGHGAPGSAPPGRVASAGWSDQPIDVAPLKSADVDFAVSANSLLYRKIKVGQSALALHLKDGRLEADLSELALYQGGGKGKVVVDGSGAVPAIAADFDLSRVQMEPLLKDAIDLDRLAGVGAFNLSVAGHGRSQRDIVGALDGKGSLDLANGKIRGMNLVAMVKNIATAFQSGGTQETDFASLSGTFTIQNGILRNNDLQLRSADLPMTGAGTVDLPRRSVDYRITPRVAGAVAVPVTIKGPWNDLSYQPDLAALVKEPGKLLQGGAKDIGKTLKSVPGGAGGLLDNLLGGKK